jgi:hypothetical protein
VLASANGERDIQDHILSKCSTGAGRRRKVDFASNAIYLPTQWRMEVLSWRCWRGCEQGNADTSKQGLVGSTRVFYHHVTLQPAVLTCSDQARRHVD